MIPLGFHSLPSAWLALLVPLLIAIYFLKLRRPHLSVPSLVLWQRLLRDRRVNTPFQRFKRNLLLWLQLLLLLLLILAAMQPYRRRRQDRLQRLPILVDCSASMGALDPQGRRSRLEEAKEQLMNRIDTLLPNQEICLIGFAESARSKTPFSNNTKLLKDAVRNLQCEDLRADLDEAMQLLHALQRQAAFDEVLLLSDGNLKPRVNAELAFQVTYQLLPPAGHNVGIIGLSARHAGSDAWDVLLQLAGSGEQAVSGRVELFLDQQSVAEHAVFLAGKARERLLFRIQGNAHAFLEARLEIEGPDSLAADNAAYLALPELSPLRVAVADSLTACRQALAALPDLEVLPLSEAPGADLAVVDSQDADGFPAASVLLSVGAIPTDLSACLQTLQQGTTVLDWQQDAALLRHVQLRDVTILDSPAWGAGVGPAQLEQRGFEVLAESSRGPLILGRETSGRLQFHLLFHPDRSTLPYRVAFPIMMANVAAIARARSGMDRLQAPPAGILPPVTASPGAHCTITDPRGQQTTRLANDKGILVGVPAAHAGIYTVTTEAKTLTTGVSLLTESETRLTRVEALQFQENLAVTAAAAPLQSEKPFWQLLTLLAFAVMLGEWWWYQLKSG